MDFTSDSFSGALGAAFELQPSNRSRSSTSSSSSSSLDLSSTDDDCSSPTSPRDSSWSSVENRDPFSASAKPVDGLKLYSLSDASSRTSSVARGGVRENGLVPFDVTPKGGTESVRGRIETGRERDDASESTPVYHPSSAMARRLFDETIGISEAEYWDAVLSDAIDKANGCLDLSFPRGFAGRFNGQLTYVPPNISDLRKLVVLGDKCTMGAGARPITRPFSRTASAPASSSFLHRQNMDSYHRAPGFNHGGARHSTSVGTAQGQQQEAIIQLYLAGNALRSLPREMFSLKGLTVLSLRGNQIEYLPPSICCLTSLKELNVSNNRLQYLPAEILQLPIDSLRLNANPLLKPTARVVPATSSDGETSSRHQRILGPMTRYWPDQGPVPPLYEMAYRVLLSPMGTAPAQALNWQMYDVNEWFARGPKYREVFKVLSAATVDDSASLRKDPADNAESPDPPRQHSTFPSTPLLVAAAHFPHTCPSPMHRPHRRVLARSTTSRTLLDEQQSFGGTGIAGVNTATRTYFSHSQMLPYTSPETHFPASGQGAPSTFLSHAEERMEWVTQIGRVSFPSSGLIPILWRGCSNGCLIFLDEEDSSQAVEHRSTLLARGIAAVDSQRTIRPGAFDEEEEEFIVQDGFDIDDLDGLGT